MGRFFSYKRSSYLLHSARADNSPLSTLLRRAAISRFTSHTIHISYTIKPRDKCRSCKPVKRLAPNLHRNQLCSINREVTSKSDDLLLSLHFRCTGSLMANREKYEFTLVTHNFTVVTYYKLQSVCRKCRKAGKMIGHN